MSSWFSPVLWLIIDSTASWVWSASVECSHHPNILKGKLALGRFVYVVLVHSKIPQEQYVLAIIYEPTTYLTKLSLLLVYHRLFSIHRTTRYLVYLGIAANTIFYFIMMVLFVFLKSVAAGHTLSVVLGGVNILSDFYILCIPISAVSRLQMPLRKKIGVMTVFSTGFL